jgi:hypothetical protein
LRVNELAGTGPALVKPRPQATPQTPASSDARAAAAELARGAVEVARGVWDGLRTASGPRPGESGTPMRTGSEGLELVRPNAAPPPIPRAPMGNEVIVMHTLSGNDEAHDDFGTRIDPRALATAGVTIPVPPPVKGGWFGTLFSTAALALEMLVALARGLSGSVWRGVVRGKGAGAGAMRGLGTLTRSAFRLFLFLALLALLGGLSTLVFYAIFS